MAILDDEKRELADKFALGKAYTNENASVNNEAFFTVPTILGSIDVWSINPPDNPGPVAGQFDATDSLPLPSPFTVVRYGDLGTSASIFQLYTVPSTGPALGQEQAFLTVQSQPVSDSLANVNAVRAQNLPSPRFTDPSLGGGLAHAGEAVAGDRGYRMLLIPALTGGGSPTPDTANAITAVSPTINTIIDPSGADSRATIDYKAGVVRLSIEPPATGTPSNTDINPNNVFDSNGRVILFAIFFQYTDNFGGAIDAQDVTFTSTAGLASTNVAEALDELELTIVNFQASLASQTDPGSSLIGVDAIPAGTVLTPTLVATNLDIQLQAIYSKVDTYLSELADPTFPGADLVGGDFLSTGTVLPSIPANVLATQIPTMYSNIDSALASVSGSGTLAHGFVNIENTPFLSLTFGEPGKIPFRTGSGASVTDPSAGPLDTLVSGLNNITTWIGEAGVLLTMTGASNSSLNTSFLISEVISSSSVYILTTPGSHTLPDANNGSIQWELYGGFQASALLRSTLGSTGIQDPGLVVRTSTDGGHDAAMGNSPEYELFKKGDEDTQIWHPYVNRHLFQEYDDNNIFLVEDTDDDTMSIDARIIRGLGLALNANLSGGFWLARVQCQTGMAMFADGRVATLFTSTSADFGDGVTPNAELDGTTPTFPNWFYYFVRKLNDINGTIDQTLYYSTAAPDSFNRPSGTPTLGNKNDYVYVGCQRWIVHRAAAAASPFPVTWDVYGQSAIIERNSDYRRSRITFFPDSYNDTDGGSLDFRQSDVDSTAAGAALAVTAFVVSGVTNPLPSVFRRMIVEVELVLAETGGAICTLLVQSIHGMITRRVDLLANGQERLHFTIECNREGVTNNNDSCEIMVSQLSGSNNYSATASFILVGAEEFTDGID